MFRALLLQAPRLAPHNLLLSGFGEVNKMTFTNPTADKVFGVPKLSDPENARDLTMLWQEHRANPDDVPGLF